VCTRLNWALHKREKPDQAATLSAVFTKLVSVFLLSGYCRMELVAYFWANSAQNIEKSAAYDIEW
jgi:hypothetical protein